MNAPHIFFEVPGTFSRGNAMWCTSRPDISSSCSPTPALVCSPGGGLGRAGVCVPARRADFFYFGKYLFRSESSIRTYRYISV